MAKTNKFAKGSVHLLIWSVPVVALIGLFVFSYLGLFNRYWADDWCYNADFKNLGFLGTLQGYFYITTYASNRISLTFFSGILQLLEIPGVQLLPAILIATFVLVSTNLVYKIFTSFGLSVPWQTAFVLASVLSFFVVYLAPNRFQSVYWRSGVLPYTFPLLMMLAIALLLLNILQVNKTPSRAQIVLLAGLSFVAGGFSEAGAVILLTGLLLSLLLVLLFHPLSWKAGAFIALFVALIGTLLSVAVLMLSPANALRHTGAYPDPKGLVETILLSFRYGFDFVWLSLRGLPLPHSILVLFSAALGAFMANNFATNLPSLKKASVWVVGMLLFAYILISANQAPTTMFEGGPPADRALIFSRYFILLALSLAFFMVGIILAKKSETRKTVLSGVSVVIILTTAIYVVRAVNILVTDELPRFVQRAQVWDTREQQILQARAHGQTRIEVQAIDSFYMGSTIEMGAEPNWINLCAADFYDMQEILATIPP